MSVKVKPKHEEEAGVSENKRMRETGEREVKRGFKERPTRPVLSSTQTRVTADTDDTQENLQQELQWD